MKCKKVWMAAICAMVFAGESLALPRASDYAAFVEAEQPKSVSLFCAEQSTRTQLCSGGKWLNVWSPSFPASGAMAEYEINVPTAGKYWVVVWAEALDAGTSSPFWVSVGGQKLHFTAKSATIPQWQNRYGCGVTFHSMGPVKLEAGKQTLTLRVNERRAYKAENERAGAYNLNVDAIALSCIDPSKRASAGPVTVRVDAPAGPAFEPIMDFSQGGIGDVVDTTFWSSMRPLLKELRPNLIRIDHVWDYYGVVSRAADGSLKYDWSRFDRVLDEIRATGAKPFLSVSYLPEILRGPTGRPCGKPSDYAVWQDICAELSRHMKNDRGEAGLYYEAWNEPDGSGFWDGTQAEYHELYRRMVAGVRSVDATAKVGGPATALSGWVSGFVEFVAKEKLPMNFVSWHWYNVMFDVASYAQQSQSVRTILSKAGYGDEVELFFTEWNMNGSIVPYNDEFYSAANTLATLDVFHREKMKHAFFFMPKDPAGEKELGGWFAAITNKNRPKPSYNALLAYSKVRGKGMTVTTSDDRLSAFAASEGGVVRVVVWQFDGGAPFAATRVAKLNVAMPAGEYEQTTWAIDHQHSSIMETPKQPELTKVETKAVKVEGAGFRREVSVENGGVVLMEFRKK